MKRLYEIEVKYYVMAENELEAQDIEPDYISNCSVFASEANSVDHDWWNAVPYNSDDDKTCGQVLNEKEEAGGRSSK